MREQLTIPPTALQAFLKAVDLEGYSEQQGLEYIRNRKRRERESGRPFGIGIGFAAIRALDHNSSSSLLDVIDPGRRKREQVLDELYDRYILGKDIDSDIPSFRLPTVTESDRERVQILHDLSPDKCFDSIRDFLESLEVFEMKLVWPNKRTHDKAELVRKFDLALLLYHLNTKEGLQSDLTDWASYGAKCFVWQDYSSVSNTYLSNKFDRYNDYVEQLSDSKVTRMIKALYA